MWNISGKSMANFFFSYSHSVFTIRGVLLPGYEVVVVLGVVPSASIPSFCSACYKAILVWTLQGPPKHTLISKMQTCVILNWFLLVVHCAVQTNIASIHRVPNHCSSPKLLFIFISPPALPISTCCSFGTWLVPPII